MPKGHKSNAKCSQLRKPDCMQNSEECVWCRGKGRCFVASYASRRACHTTKTQTTQPDSIPAHRPSPVDVRTPQGYHIETTETEREYAPVAKVACDDTTVISKVVKKLCGSVFQSPPTQILINNKLSNVQDFIRVHFLRIYTKEALQGYHGLLRDLSHIGTYQGMKPGVRAAAFGLAIMETIVSSSS